MKKRKLFLSVVVMAAYAVLSIAVTYPLVLHLRSHIPGDSGDPLLNTWIFGWDTKALMHHPTGIYEAPVFYPHHHALAYSENLFGFLGLIFPFVSITGNFVFGYNIAFLFTFWASFMGMYLLALLLSKNRLSAFAVGAIFGVAPYHWAQISHLHILFYGWVVFTLLSVAIYIKNESMSSLLLVAVTYFFGVMSSLHVAVFSTISLLVLEIVLWASGELERRSFFRLLAVEAGVLFVSSLVLYPYFLLSRSISGDRLPQLATGGLVWPTDFVSASPLLKLLGGITERFREIHHQNSEMQLYPGIVMTALSVLGIYRLRERTPSLRRSFLFSGIALLGVGLLFSIGIGVYVDFIRMVGVRQWMLIPLHLVSPIRVAARWIVIAWIGMGILAACGLSALSRSARSRSAIAGYVVVIAIFALGLAESWAAPVPVVRIATMRELPEVYHWLARQRGDFSILELPPHYPELSEETYRMYAQLLHGKKLILGYSGIVPEDVKELYKLFVGFPNPTSVGKITELGRRAKLRYVIFETGAGDRKSREAFASNLCWLREDGRLRFVKRFGDSHVFEVESFPGALKFETQASSMSGAEFSGFATLSAYDEGVTSDGRLFVRLHWVVDGKWDYRKSVTLQAFDENGKLLAQADGPPVRDEFLSCWNLGARVTDPRILKLGPGDVERIARLGVAVYDWKTLKRLPVKVGGRVSGDKFLYLKVMWRR